MSEPNDSNFYEVEVEVNGKKQKLKVPKVLQFREDQNPECNLKKGSICSLYRGQKVCLKVETDGEKITGFGMLPCEKNPNKAIRIEDEKDD